MSAWKNGRVQWFDKSSGEGVIVSDNGESFYVHYSTIIPKNSRSLTIARQKERRNLDAGEAVKFQVYENSYSKRIDKVKAV